MSPSPSIRDALRTVYACAPEAAAIIERYIDEIESVNRMLSDDKAFEAFVLEQARLAGRMLSLMERLDASCLADLAAAERADAEVRLMEAAERRDRTMTLRSVLSQPVVLAVIGVASTVLTTIGTLILHLAGVTR